MSSTNLPKDLLFDHVSALAFMVIPDMHGECLKTVGCLNANDKLLYYSMGHFLTPRMANFSKVMKKKKTFLLCGF